MTAGYKSAHPLPRDPKGWFALDLSHALKPGQVKPVSAVGRDLVVFRTASGRAVVLDAYCPHLGAHLGHGGHVDGETLRCPFHHWAFGPDGACTNIPYSPGIPARAATASLPVIERNGAVLAWFDPGQGPPEWDIPECPADTWSDTRWLERTYTAHIQEFAENGVDLGHFPIVHGSNRAGVHMLDTVGIPFRFTLQTAYPGDGIGLPGQHVDVDTDWFFFGLSVFLGISTAQEFGTQVRQIYHFTPAPDDTVVLRVGFAANLRTIPADMVEEVQSRNLQILIQNFEEDRVIWQRKRYLTRPVLCAGDGPFGTLRRWTRQFYRAEASVAAAPTSYPPMSDLPASALPTAACPDGSELRDEPASGMSEPRPQPPPRDVAQTGALTVHDTFFRILPASFSPAAAKGREFVVQYDITGAGGGAYFATVHDGICTPAEGAHPSPTVTVSVGTEDWLRLNAGTLSRPKAFMTGRLRVKGDLTLAYKLGDIFPA